MFLLPAVYLVQMSQTGVDVVSTGDAFKGGVRRTSVCSSPVHLSLFFHKSLRILLERQRYWTV